MNCIACEGTGVSSKGHPCFPCQGTGQKQQFVRDARSCFDYEIRKKPIVICPVCDRKASLREVSLTPRLVVKLIELVRLTVENESEGGWVYGWDQAAELGFWGLMETKSDPAADWPPVRATDKAISFVTGEISLSMTVGIAATEGEPPTVAKSPKVVNVRQALGDEYDYEQLMQ